MAFHSASAIGISIFAGSFICTTGSAFDTPKRDEDKTISITDSSSSSENPDRIDGGNASESFLITIKDLNNKDQDGKSAKIELHLKVGDKGVANLWEDTAKALFDFADRNVDGFLDESELGNVVAPSAIQQIQWGQFAPVLNNSLKLGVIDANRDSRIDFKELKDWYGSFGLGGISVSLLRMPRGAEIDNLLLAALDIDGNSSLSETELRSAKSALSKFDQDHNLVIEPNEVLLQNDILTKRPVAVLKPYSDRRQWTSADGKTLVTMEVSSGSLSGQMQFDQTTIGTPTQSNSEKPLSPSENEHDRTWAIECDLEQLRSPNVNLFSKPFRRNIDGTCVIITEWECETHDAYQQFVKQATDRFLAVDVNQDGFVDSEEARAPHAFDMSGLLAVADRDKDGLLKKEELDRWFALMQLASSWVAQLNLVQHDSRLFMALDQDGDGRLSQRELDEAQSTLHRDYSIDADISMDRLIKNLPNFWSIELAGGKLKGSMPKRTYAIPYWFLGMDRNRDGDVSRLEFLGDDVAFEGYDKNKDGYISGTELN